MKILMINKSSFGVGGEKTYINSLEKSLKDRGHEVYYVGLDQERLLKTKHKTVYKYGFKNKIQWFASENLINLSLYTKIRRNIRSINPDIIHLHSISRATRTILLACRGYKVIQTVHGFGIVCPLSSLTVKNEKYRICNGMKGLKCYRNGCIKLQTNLLDFFLFNNTFLKKLIISEFICPSRKLYALCKRYGYKPVYLPYFVDYKQKIRQKKSNNILFVGRLEELKGMSYLLQAFKIITKERENLTLTIVGDGSESVHLKNLAKKLWVEAKFVGEVVHTALKKYYEDCFVVVIPSIWMEQFGIVALEAMSYGKPVIASNIGGLSELIKEGVNGFLVDRFDIQMMAKRILTLSKNKKRAITMGLIGKEMLTTRWNKEEHIDRILNIYNKWVET